MNETGHNLNPEWKCHSNRTAAGCPNWRRTFGVMTGEFPILAVLCGSLALQNSLTAAIATEGLNSDLLYNLTNVWTVHLKLSPDQWEAMEPKGGLNPFGGFGGGGPRERPGGPGGFSLAMLFSPAFMAEG